MKKRGLKGSHVQYLAAFDRYRDGLTPSELCEICQRDKVAVSRAIFQMEEEGMIYRPDNDLRTYRVKLFLTEKGEEAVTMIRECPILPSALPERGFPKTKKKYSIGFFKKIPTTWMI